MSWPPIPDTAGGRPITDERPLHAQLNTLLRGRILAGLYKPGERIDSENQLCNQFGVSRATVRRAIDALRSDGLLITHRGSGTYVADPLPHQFESRPDARSTLTGFLDDLYLQASWMQDRDHKHTCLPAGPAIAAALGCRCGTTVHLVTRVQVVDGHRIGWGEDVFPANVGRLLTPAGIRGARSVLHALSRAGLQPSYATHRIAAVVADHDIAAALDVSKGQPLVEIRGILRGMHMKPIDAYRHLVLPEYGPQVEYVMVGRPEALGQYAPSPRRSCDDRRPTRCRSDPQN